MTIYQSLPYHNNINVTNVFIITGLLFCLCAYVKFSWSRRRMYYLASKLKGPVSLPIIGNAYFGLWISSRTFIQLLEKAAERYGNGTRVWAGFKLLVGIMDAKDTAIILNSRDCLEKDWMYDTAKPIFGNGLLTAPVSEWKGHKKLIMPYFNQRILNEFVKVFDEKSLILVRKLRSECNNGQIDVLSRTTNCLLDIVCETALNWKGDFQNNGAIHSENMTVLMETIWLRFFNPHYYFDFTFRLTKQHKKFAGALKCLRTLAEKIIQEKAEKFGKDKRNGVHETKADEQQGTYSKTFLDYFIENTSIEDKTTAAYLRDEVVTMIIGGTDTAAILSCFTLLMLALHQDVQDKVYEEVINVLGPDRAILASDLPNLVCLERVIKEAMRLFPVAGLIGRSVQEDTKLTSFTLPAGTIAVIAIYKLHRNPKYWTDPDKFDPDRFLPDEVAKRHPYAFIPFSAGPRNCIGSKYGMMVLKTMMAHIIRKYKIYTSYKSLEEVEFVLEFFVKPVNGFNISMQPR